MNGRAALHLGDGILLEGRAASAGGIDGAWVRLDDDVGRTQCSADAGLCGAGLGLPDAGASPLRLDRAELLKALPEEHLGSFDAFAGQLTTATKACKRYG